MRRRFISAVVLAALFAVSDVCAMDAASVSATVSEKSSEKAKKESKPKKESDAAKQKKVKSGYEKTDIYIFGTSFSFSDSIMYMTEVQKLDSVMVRADYFLDGQDDYDSQFKKWLEAGGSSMQVASSQFFVKKSKADKKYAKVKKNAIRKHRCTIITVPDFKYTRIQ